MTPTNPLVLVVEDEPHQAELLLYNLASSGYRTEHAADGETAVRIAREEEPDIIVLDWMLPNLSGIDVCRTLRHDRATRDIPIIMLTARGEESDRVHGLDSGVDDYIVKPFLPSELMARIRAVLRRTRPGKSASRIDVGDLSLDLDTYTVTYGGDAIGLSITEFRILAALAERPEKVFSRERLLDLAWERGIHVEIRTVDVHIRRLRKQLTATGKKDPIRTVRGVGYALSSGGPDG